MKPLKFKGRNVALETDWDFKIFLKFSDFVFFLEKKTWVFHEKNLISSKIAKSCKFEAECDWKNEVAKNNQNLGFFKQIDRFLETNVWLLSKLLIVKRRKCAVEGDWGSKSAQTVQTLGFLNRIVGSSEKKGWTFVETRKVKCRRFAVENDWDGENPRNVQILVLFNKK